MNLVLKHLILEYLILEFLVPWLFIEWGKQKEPKATDLVLHRSRGQKVWLQASTLLLQQLVTLPSADECLEASTE